MTHLPPPANDPGQSCPDDQERRRADRPSTDQPSIAHRIRNPRLELSTPIRFTSTPFAWQHGARLYLLVNESTGWVLAELKFVPSACHYVEIRRTTYRWPREAASVLLSRSLGAGEDTCGQLAADVKRWLTTANDQVAVWYRDQ